MVKNQYYFDGKLSPTPSLVRHQGHTSLPVSGFPYVDDGNDKVMAKVMPTYVGILKAEVFN